MAARRAAVKAIDWIAFAERVPPNQKAQFTALKARSDAIYSKFLSTPEKPAAINFAFYKSRLANPALVDEFEQKFNAVKIPEPMDTYTAGLDEAQKKAQADVQKFIADSNARIKKYEEQASVYKSLPPTDLMTYDDVFAAFPEMKPDKEKYPIWPHKPIE
ncbi:ATP synthase subunit d, mitochondrial-like [Branchiostoma lanceolatum]|uniref:ATP synthase subunit d, mitochondrial-like n=1 Tax=Branchiostoma lanceolatum TaxID=7740 RepID=UPI003452251C